MNVNDRRAPWIAAGVAVIAAAATAIFLPRGDRDEQVNTLTANEAAVEAQPSASSSSTTTSSGVAVLPEPQGGQLTVAHTSHRLAAMMEPSDPTMTHHHKLTWHFANSESMSTEGKIIVYSWSDALPGDRATFELLADNKRTQSLTLLLPNALPTRKFGAPETLNDQDLRVVTVMTHTQWFESAHSARLRRLKWNYSPTTPAWAKILKPANVTHVVTSTSDSLGVRMYDPAKDGN